MLRFGKTLRILLGALFAVAVLVGALIFLSAEARWRINVIALKGTGKIDHLPWNDLLPMLKPGSGFWLEPLVKSRNPYATIRNPRGEPGDVNTGKAMFRYQCQTCHGVGGRGGGVAPALVGRDLSHGASDWALYEIIKYGVSGTPMTAHEFPANDLWKLVAYVQNIRLQHAESQAVASASSLPEFSVPFEALRSAQYAAADWPTYYGSYNGTRYSSLEHINRSNVRQLQARWIYQMPSRGARMEASPIIVDGRLFVTDPDGGVIALDAATGSRLWRYSRPAPHDVQLCCVTANRGVAALNGAVFVATLDAHLIALDAVTGKVLWDQVIVDYRKGYSSTGAPIAVKDMIVTGIAGSEYGAMGFVAAFNATTGAKLWQFDTIPKPGEKGSDTWAGDSWRTGGAATWMTGTYDADLDLIYWGVANPAPDFDASKRAGDNLYSNSVVALRASSGQLAWYFQFTPGDDHDWDAVQVPVLADVVDGTQTKKLLLQANRNGFFYALDRATGKFIGATPFIDQTWAESIDAAGRPRKRPNISPSLRGTLLNPSSTGATNWWPPTFNPKAQLFVVPALERPGLYFKTDVEEGEGKELLGGTSPGATESHVMAMRALDPRSGRLKWERRAVNNREAFTSGLLSTAGGLVFMSEQSKLIALDIDDGRQLWSFEAGGQVLAPPSTYRIGAEQYVAFAAGDVIVGLSLPAAVQSGVQKPAH
jgi:alcohol dehydrogenase (cytochrome c)